MSAIPRNYLFNESETQIGDRVVIDKEIQTGAIIAKEFLDKIRSQPTADVAEVKHGEWSRGTEPNGSVYAHCSACNRKMNSYCYGYAHCPLCGARMDGNNVPTK